MKLNQAIAIEKSIKSQTETQITAAYHGLQRFEGFNGQVREYTPKDAEGETLPGERVNVTVTVQNLVNDFTAALTKLFDITATKVTANTGAKADIVLDGVTIVPNVPVELLLFFEKRLGDVHTFVSKIPTLDPAVTWTLDPALGIYRTEPSRTNRSKKVLKNHVKAEATDKHPAQVETYTEDETVGYWDTTKFSGATTQTQVKQWLANVAKLQAAVKMARETANSADAMEISVGQVVMTHIFGARNGQ